jgi:CheY-like chemotaxis protein
MNYSIKSILLIDDDQDDKFFFARALREVESEIDLMTASDGKDALKKLEERIPDMILLDLNMPVMNGISFLKIRKRDKILREIPVVVYTDGLNVFDESEVMQLGAYGVIIKANDLKGTIRIITEIVKMSFIRMSA